LDDEIPTENLCSRNPPQLFGAFTDGFFFVTSKIAVFTDKRAKNGQKLTFSLFLVIKIRWFRGHRQIEQISPWVHEHGGRFPFSHRALVAPFPALKQVANNRLERSFPKPKKPTSPALTFVG